MEIPVANLNFVLSAVDNVLSQKMTLHNVSLSEDNTSLMFGDDDHGMSRQPRGRESFVAWGARAFTSGRHYWRQMWRSPPTGFWESVKTSWQVIPLTALILKKHFFSFLWMWMIIIVSTPMLDPQFSMWKGLWVGLVCFWIMTMELWASMTFSGVPSYIVSSLPPSPPLWSFSFALGLHELPISGTIYWNYFSGDIAVLNLMWGHRIPAHCYLM